jgi:HlyD family secretion protein
MRRAGRWIISVLVVRVLVVIGYAGYQRYLAPVPPTPTPPPAATPRKQSVSAEASVVPQRDATLAFKIGGKVVEVLVKPGDAVTAGQPLIRLEADDLRAAVAQAEAGVELARAQLTQAQAGARAEEIAVAQANLAAAQAAVAQAQAQYDNVRSGARREEIAAAQAQLEAAQAQLTYAEAVHDATMQGFGPKEWQARQQREAARASVEGAQANLDLLKAGPTGAQVRQAQSGIDVASAQANAAQAQLALVEAGPRAEDLAVLEAGVKQAKAALEQAQAALTQTELTAPFAGTVAEVMPEVGEVVGPGAPVVILANLDNWQIKTEDLSEVDVVQVKVGQPATITLDAFPGQTFSGRVADIALISAETRGDVVYRVTIDLDEPGVALRWGMTAFVDIQVGE